MLFDTVYQHGHAAAGHAVGGLADGGEPGGQVGRQLDAVKPADRHILRHPQAVVPQRPYGADGHDVTEGEYRGQPGHRLQQLFHGGVAARQGVAGRHILGGQVQRHAVAGQFPDAAAEAGGTGLGGNQVAADKGDAPVAVVQQVGHHAGGGCRVVHADAGQVFDGFPRGGVGHQQAGHAQLLQVGAEMVAVRPQKDHPVGFVFPADLPGAVHLVVLFVNVVDHAVVAGGAALGLQFFQHQGKQHVVGAFYDHGNALAGLLFQVFGVGVGPEVVFFNDRPDAGPGRRADVGVVVDDAGHGAHGVAGLPGNVLDGHGGVPLSFDESPAGRGAGLSP